MLARRGALLLLLSAAALACRSRPDESSWAMHPDHAGPVRFGVPVAEALRAFGDSATAIPTTGCTYWRPANAPPGMSVMIEEGVVMRADVDSAGPETPEGIGVGSTEAAIRDAYGQHVTIQLHKYQWEAGWRYFIYLPPDDSLNAAVFETDGNRVRNYRVGRRPQVQYVERCG